MGPQFVAVQRDEAYSRHFDAVYNLALRDTYLAALPAAVHDPSLDMWTFMVAVCACAQPLRLWRLMRKQCRRLDVVRCCGSSTVVQLKRPSCG